MADATDQAACFAVYPRTDCPHVASRLAVTGDGFTLQRPCHCGNVGENWLCLTCGDSFCSRFVNGHMVHHWELTVSAPVSHCVCLSFSDLSFWCMECDSYITHPSLETLKRAVHLAKFGVEPGADALKSPAAATLAVHDSATAAAAAGSATAAHAPSFDFAAKEASALAAVAGLGDPGGKTGVVYDQRMCDHSIMKGDHPERPQRIERIFAALRSSGVLAKCRILKSRQATDAEIECCHTKEHRVKMDGLNAITEDRLFMEMGYQFNSIYLNKGTALAARLAAGCLLELTHAVVTGVVANGVAVIRPPGHHAEAHVCMGFCIFNNVAIAAKQARQHWGCKRVLIVDWDVHHGNGTQNMFDTDASVLYFSVHRFDDGQFYPGGMEMSPAYVGKDAGRGFSVNVGWNCQRVNDAEYLACWADVLMPIAREFSPDLVIVSAGFDAALGDPLGGCCITPEGYGLMTAQLQTLAGGRVVIALEGGYNLSSIASSMVACASVLHGQPPAPLATPVPAPRPSTLDSIAATIAAQAPYWTCLQTARGDVGVASAADATVTAAALALDNLKIHD